jgi:hypothetical protein
MPEITIAGLEARVSVQTGTESTEDLTRRRARFSGEDSAVVVQGRAYARVWEMETVQDMARADVDALEVRLLAPGTVTLSGDYIDDSVVCDVERVGRREHVLERATLTMRLRERLA